MEQDDEHEQEADPEEEQESSNVMPLTQAPQRQYLPDTKANALSFPLICDKFEQALKQHDSGKRSVAVRAQIYT